MPPRREGAIDAAFAAVVGIGLIVILPIVMDQRRLTVTTDGVIVDKRVAITRACVRYLLVIRAANGEQLNVSVPVQMNRKASAGMHAVKRPGHEWPDLEP